MSGREKGSRSRKGRVSMIAGLHGGGGLTIVAAPPSWRNAID
jgi:hypothetical protein